MSIDLNNVLMDNRKATADKARSAVSAVVCARIRSVRAWSPRWREGVCWDALEAGSAAGWCNFSLFYLVSQ